MTSGCHSLMTLVAQTPTDTLQSAENEELLAMFDDSDGDGFTDDVDAFPLDSTQWSDLDGDGYEAIITDSPKLFKCILSKSKRMERHR